MRLWSLHPKYLDVRGLTACWREGLLARKVLSGETAGYRRHPQLQRFSAQTDPVGAIDAYLWAIYDEARRRGYRFNGTKLGISSPDTTIPVTRGQVQYEWNHLLLKLELRDPLRRSRLGLETVVEVHPLFEVIEGKIEIWEKL